MAYALQVLCAVFFMISVMCFIYIVWMKLTARYSKPRFAFYTVLTLFSTVLLTISAITAIDWIGYIQYILESVGLLAHPAQPSASTFVKVLEKIIIAFFGGVALLCIVLFSSRALTNWDGPVTKNAAKVGESGQPNSITALAMAEIVAKITRQNDPVVDRKALDWRQQIAPPPGQVEFRELARSAFLNHLPEASIETTAWRQQGKAWIGTIFGPAVGAQSDLVLLIFDVVPNNEELERRILAVPGNQDCQFFGVVEFSEAISSTTRAVANRSIEIWPYRSMVRSGLPLQNYARQLIKQFEQSTVGGTKATLADTYVDATVMNSTGERSLLRNVVGGWLQEPGRKHLAITGEYGQGKSTAMLELCVQWARLFLANSESHADRVPLLVELRGKSPGELSPNEFLAQWGIRYGLQADKVLALIQSGQALLIFEGFDELRNAGRQFERHEHFNALWRFAYPGTKIILTGRPNFFIDQVERNSTLRIDDNIGAASNAFTQMYSIAMFSREEVEKACRAYDPETRGGILRSLDNHPDFREIVVRPSMLPVVATIWPEIEALEQSGESITGSMLLERYLTATYVRKEAELENERLNFQVPSMGSYLLLPRALREALTLSVVWEMAAKDLRNTIPRAQFDFVIDTVFENILRALQSTGVRGPIVEAARQIEVRFSSENRAEFMEKVCTDVASAGLFVPDPVGGSSNLRFAHKQYFEYLIAKFAWVRLAMPDDDLVKALLPARIGFNASTLWQSEAIIPFARLMHKNFSCFRRYKRRLGLVIITEYALAMTMSNLEIVSNYLISIFSRLSPKYGAPSTENFDTQGKNNESKFVEFVRTQVMPRRAAIGLGYIVTGMMGFVLLITIKGAAAILAILIVSLFSIVPMGLLIYMRTGVAEFFLDVTRLIWRIQRGDRKGHHFLFMLRQKSLHYASYPEATVSIREVVTGVPVPETLTKA